MLDAQQLSDRIEIADLVTRYTRAIDSGDWDGLDDVFTPDARIDYTSAGGRAGDFTTMKAWLAEVLPRFVRRLHVIGQISVDLGEDSASITAYFSNPMVALDEDGAELLTDTGGYYHHQLVRTEAGWRSRELIEETMWNR